MTTTAPSDSSPLPPTPFRLYTNRKKNLLLLIISLLLTGTGIMMVLQNMSGGYVCAIFFGLAALAFLIQLFPNASYLELRDDGFTVCSMFRQTVVRWNDVHEFRTVNPGLLPMAGWNYREDYVPLHTVRKGLRATAGADGALSDVYGMSAQALVDLLNRMKAAHTPAADA